MRDPDGTEWLKDKRPEDLPGSLEEALRAGVLYDIEDLGIAYKIHLSGGTEGHGSKIVQYGDFNESGQAVWSHASGLDPRFLDWPLGSTSLDRPDVQPTGSPPHTQSGPSSDAPSTSPSDVLAEDTAAWAMVDRRRGEWLRKMTRHGRLAELTRRYRVAGGREHSYTCYRIPYRDSKFWWTELELVSSNGRKRPATPSAAEALRLTADLVAEDGIPACLRDVGHPVAIVQWNWRRQGITVHEFSIGILPYI